MLKRRKRIQKYINAIKSKKQNLAKHPVIQHSLLNTNQKQLGIHSKSIKNTERSILQRQIQTSYIYDKLTSDQRSVQLWHDSDDQGCNLDISNKKSVYKKLDLPESVNQKQYESKLKNFYEKRYKIKNWARTGDGQQELDIEDYLDEEQNYRVKDSDKVQNRIIKHFGRTSEKHQSIVTGMDWHGSVLFTCGYDQILKIFKINQDQENPDLKIKLQKDILINKLPLANCIYYQGQVYCATLRKNLAIIDIVKEKITYVTSSFLADHKKYENLRVSKENGQKMLFFGNKISILDQKNFYTGSLLANDQLKDAKFGKNPYELFGVTNDAIFEWDLRNYKPIKIDRTLLGYSSLEVSKDYLCAGSRLGLIYIYENNKSNPNNFSLYKQITNLTTTITHLSANQEQSIVCALSKWKKNAARVVDLNGGKCVGDWPTTKTKIQFGNLSAFSGVNDMFAVGSSNGYINIFDFENTELRDEPSLQLMA